MSAFKETGFAAGRAAASVEGGPVSLSAATRVVPSYAMRPVGGFGIRGWRVHCDCGYLSRIYTERRTVSSAAHIHRLEHRDG